MKRMYQGKFNLNGYTAMEDMIAKASVFVITMGLMWAAINLF